MDTPIQINKLWRLVDPFTVHQAAALIADVEPTMVTFNENGEVLINDPSGWSGDIEIMWIKTAFTALVNAINAGKLKAIIRRTVWQQGWNEEPNFDLGERWAEKIELLESEVEEAWGTNPTYLKQAKFIYRVEPDWGKTTIERIHLQEWLIRNGILTGYFFPDSIEIPDYLNQSHSRYAPKLAATIHAWLAFNEAEGKGKSAKQFLMKWLRENAAHYRLSDDEGKPNETGIEECAKVANWQDKGGAPKTPNL